MSLSTPEPGLLKVGLPGAPEGVDVGWAGMQRLIKEPVGKDARPALNDRQTMASTAEDMVKWYQQALRGAPCAS